MSNSNIDEDLEEVFALGMNCHLNTKIDKMRTEREIEKLFFTIKKFESEKKVIITDEDRLKCELKRFGLKDRRNFDKDLMTKEQYAKFKELMENDTITKRKADKNNVFVLMNSSA